MFLRAILYLFFSLILVILISITNTELGWNVDIVWLIVVASAFAGTAGLAPIAGLMFGLVLDGLTGSFGFYSISYGGFGVIIFILRRLFYIDGFFPAWIIAIAGAEILWLFFGLFARAVQMVGGASRIPGLLSPFLLSALIIFPLVYWISRLVLIKPGKKGHSSYFGTTARIIGKT